MNVPGIQSQNINAYLIGGGAYDGEAGIMARHHAELMSFAKEAHGDDRPSVTVMPAARRNGLLPELSDWSCYARDFEKSGAIVSEVLIGRVPLGMQRTPRAKLIECLDAAHVVWVPGGDTRWILEDIQSEGLKQHFERALNAGVIFGGTSAGALWTFGRGISDSASFSTPDDWDYIEVEGLKLVSGAALNVHDDRGERPGLRYKGSRAERFDEMLIERTILSGLALSEYAALQIVNGEGRIRTFSSGAYAHLVSQEHGVVNRSELGER